MKKTILYIFFIVILFASSCSFFEKKQDTNIIQRDTLVLVLSDMHITDILLAQNKSFDRNLKDTTGKKSYYNYLFRKYNINEYKFLETIKYYSANTKEYEEIYSDVIDELSRRKEIIISQIDSIRNAKMREKPKSKKIKQKIIEEKLREHKKLKGSEIR